MCDHDYETLIEELPDGREISVQQCSQCGHQRREHTLTTPPTHPRS